MSNEEDSFKTKYGKSPPGPFNNPDIKFTKEQQAEYLTEIQEKAYIVFNELTEGFTTNQIYMF